MGNLSYTLFWPLMRGFVRLVIGVLGGIEREGWENVPRTGGVLICPNHVCDADAPAVAVTLPRNAYFMAKEQLFHIPILGTLMRLFHGFPVRRGSADRAALRRAEELLKSGEAVVIFAEGGGNPHNTLQPLYSGPLLLALRTGVPVVPVAIQNSNQMWKYGDPLPHRSPVSIRVTYGEPLCLTDLHGQKGAIATATQRLTERLAEMLQQPVPTGRPPERD